MTLRSNNTMPARGIRSNISLIYHLLSPLFNSSTIFHQTFFMQGITSIERVQDYKFHGLRISDQSQTTQPHNHTIKYIENFTVSFNEYQSLLRVYLSSRINHNLPPPKNRNQASYLSNAYPVLNVSEPFSSIKYIFIICKLTSL